MPGRSTGSGRGSMARTGGGAIRSTNCCVRRRPSASGHLAASFRLGNADLPSFESSRLGRQNRSSRVSSSRMSVLERLLHHRLATVGSGHIGRYRLKRRSLIPFPRHTDYLRTRRQKFLTNCSSQSAIGARDQDIHRLTIHPDPPRASARAHCCAPLLPAADDSRNGSHRSRCDPQNVRCAPARPTLR